MQVTVRTPSRIHLGLIDLNGGLGRLYGSIGLALNSPPVVLEAKTSDELRILGQDVVRVKKMVDTFADAYGIEPKVELNVMQTIPEHSGLGSGTQLSMAVASALSYLTKLSAGPRDLARTMGRGKVSGIGVDAFLRGGFIVDGGVKKDSDEMAVPTWRMNFPKDWTFILVIPAESRGYSGDVEEAAFKKVVPAPREIAQDICWLLQMKMLPALIEKDIKVFGEALMEVDKKVGLYFSEVQGGVYKESLTQDLVDAMLEAGSYGAGQSSWGPAVYALVEDNVAQKVESAADSLMKEKCVGCSIIRTHANNHGAKMTVIEDAE